MISTTGRLGDHDVHRIGFGAMQLPGRGVFGPPSDHGGAVAVLRRAVELGVDHIDTAQYYGPDVANDLIREALHPYPTQLRLVSKVGARRDASGGWLPALEPAELRAGVEDNLRSLGIERLTMVNLRLGTEESDTGEAMAEQLGTLDQLRTEGKVECLGISNVSRAQAEQALELVALASVQNAYSILDRTHDDVLELCIERGLAFVPFFPLGSAFTGGPRKLAQDAAIAGVAERHDASPSQVALSWLLHRAPNILLIPGTSSIGHLEENMQSLRLSLDDDDLAQLEQVKPAGHPLAPHSE
jgi:pyridoxine 4-dehydrogenase